MEKDPSNLAAFLELMARPLPVYVCAKLESGEIKRLAKDCSCITHEGPHWLMADRSWKEQNRKLFTSVPPESISSLTFMAYAEEERARLASLKHSFQSNQIAQLFTEEQFAEIQNHG